MSASFYIKSLLPVAGSMIAEVYWLRQALPFLYENSALVSFLPRAYGSVILVNVVGTSYLLVMLGFKVSAARTACKNKALKDDDADAEARFSYPKMYAEGFSKHAKDFNCVQRGHQQALETYTQFVTLSMVGGITFPITTVLGGLVWSIARWKWAQGYASGEPDKRYENFFARGIWSGLLCQLLTASATAVGILGVNYYLK